MRKEKEKGHFYFLNLVTVVRYLNAPSNILIRKNEKVLNEKLQHYYFTT